MGRTIFVALIMSLFAVSAFAECPGYIPLKGWENGVVVHYDLAGVSDEFHDAAMIAFNLWNEANAGNNSGVFFMPANGTDHIDITVVEAPLPGNGVGLTVPPPGAMEMRDVAIFVSTNKFASNNREKYFTKIMLHEIGHTMALADVHNIDFSANPPTCGNLGVTVMNQQCGVNDSMGSTATKPTPCDNNAVKKDPQRKRDPKKDPVNCKPCTPNASLCDLKQVCQKVSPEFPDECSLELVCGKPGRDPIACCGDRALSLSATGPCGSWTEIEPLPGGFGDYACRIPGAQFEALTCAEMGLLDTPSCANGVKVTIPDLGVTCYRCPGTTPPPDGGGGPGCVPASCGYSTGQECRWLPDGCGKQHLCGTCGPSCVPGYNEAGEPIMDCSGGGPPSCDGAHNEVCYPSFKACSDECCGVCERRIGCGGESAHKCFEP